MSTDGYPAALDTEAPVIHFSYTSVHVSHHYIRERICYCVYSVEPLFQYLPASRRGDKWDGVCCGIP